MGRFWVLHLTQCQEENIQISKGFLMLNPQYVSDMKLNENEFSKCSQFQSQILAFRVKKNQCSNNAWLQNFVESKMTNE